jgi:hypothetical protein
LEKEAKFGKYVARQTTLLLAVGLALRLSDLFFSSSAIKSPLYLYFLTDNEAFYSIKRLTLHLMKNQQ